ncbi:chondroitin proteoglycan 1-like [Pecten maximus]|uniref:chondroitin proteoglycan 1-like n=1 Tax=Pecten maximus TaxID=6579 RepID=UPI0014583284|nr:chondroitin proteoglycan 1-like [Pecten maximus]
MYQHTYILVLLAVTQQYVSAATSFSCAGHTIGFYPDPNECESYYICTGGADTTAITCATGLQFNSQSKFCDYPKNVDCNGRHSAATQPPPTQRPVVTMAPITTNAPFNMNTNAPVTNVPLQTGRPSFTNPPQPTFLPPTNSPLQTFAPLQTAAPATYAPLQTPQPGVHFVKTTPNSVTNAPATNSPFQTGGIFFPLFTNTPRPTNAPYSTRSPQTNPPMLPSSNICFGKVDGYFLDPKDCGYYYQCSYGQAVREPCPPRLVFNEKTNACDYAQNVPACSQYLLQGPEIKRASVNGIGVFFNLNRTLLYSLDICIRSSLCLLSEYGLRNAFPSFISFEQFQQLQMVFQPFPFAILFVASVDIY